MGCCGQGRARLAQGPTTGLPAAPGRTESLPSASAGLGRRPPTGGPPASVPPDASRAWFQYTGPTALTVVGGKTGTRYRFARHGAVVGVEASDRRSVAAVPGLRQVVGP